MYSRSAQAVLLHVSILARSTFNFYIKIVTHPNLESKNGTKHLHVHLAACTMKKVNSNGKTLSQSSLRFSSSGQGKVSVENYTFDQDFARKMLASMIVLHEYPLFIVDHTGFRRFVTALQPLFNMVTRNTIRKDILDAYKVERKKAIEYMAANRSRVAITTDLWTADNQKKGYMEITGHFIDDSWKLRNVIMRYSSSLSCYNVSLDVH